MKRNSNAAAAVIFLGIVWAIFLLMLANSIYKNMVQITIPTIIKLKNLEELINGSR